MICYMTSTALGRKFLKVGHVTSTALGRKFLKISHMTNFFLLLYAAVVTAQITNLYTGFLAKLSSEAVQYTTEHTKRKITQP